MQGSVPLKKYKNDFCKERFERMILLYIPETYGSSAYQPEMWNTDDTRVHESETSSERKPQKRTVTKRAKRFFCLAAVWGCAILLLVRYAVITEECRRAEELADTLAETHAAVVQEELKLNKEINLGAVEEYATEKLGMVRPGPSQEVYISICQNDAGEVLRTPQQEGVFASIGNRILSMLEYLY